jgi:hypothetical protein
MSELLRQQLLGSLALGATDMTAEDRITDMQAAIKALVAAQTEMTAAHKGKINPAFKNKYATLSDVMDASLPALRNHGFALMQPIGRDDHGGFVETVLLHESGHQFSTRVYLIIGKNDMQGFGSAVTYARRYGLAALAGVSDTDDDGNAAAKSKQSAPVRPVETPHDEDGVVIPARANPAQAASDGLRDAWKDGITDSLPFPCSTAKEYDDLSPTQRSAYWKAFADALVSAFTLKKTAAGVSGQWDKRDELIMEMQEANPPQYHRVLEAFNDKMRTFEPSDRMIAEGTFGG